VARLSPETRGDGLSPEESCGSACCRGPVVLSKKKKRKAEKERRQKAGDTIGGGQTRTSEFAGFICILYILFVFYYILLKCPFCYLFFLKKIYSK